MRKRKIILIHYHNTSSHFGIFPINNFSLFIFHSCKQIYIYTLGTLYSVVHHTISHMAAVSIMAIFNDCYNLVWML